ncbi:MAG: hypothetical protein AB7L91_11175 [Dehalococcoidia bacterium]
MLPTLVAAQKAASGVPFVKVELSDRDVGATRLRWERWYSGTENAGACAVATPADGSLLRARIDGSTMSHQRVANPGPGSSYSSWSALGTVAAAPRLGLAAAGTRALLVFVNVAGTGVQVRESTNSGASFGGSTTLVTAGGTVTAVTCTLQADGTASVFYAVAGVVRSMRRTGLGAWGLPSVWTNSLASVSALTAYFEADDNLLVSGVDGAGSAGVWATIFGSNGNAPLNVWTGLLEVATAASGTNVTYLATGIGRANDYPRGALVEAYSGGGAYQRVHLTIGLDIAGPLEWREPLPFDFASQHGLGMALEGTHAWLAAPNGVWHADASFALPQDLTDDVLEVDYLQSLDDGRLRVVLRNDDGRYNADGAPVALSGGGELRIGPGYVTTAGEQDASGLAFHITSVRRARARGRAVAVVEAVDGWGLLEAWAAPKQFVWAAGSTSVYTIVRRLMRAVGLTLSITPGSNESGVFNPGFTVPAGDSARSAVRRLLAMVPDAVLMRGAVGPVMFEVDPAQAVDYDFGTDHPILELGIEDGRTGVGWSRVFGSGVFAQAVDAEALRDGAGTVLLADDSLTVQARADARAETVLRKRTLAVDRGELVVPPNVGQEAGDVVSVTDASLGLSAEPFRVRSVRLRFDRGRSPAVYEMTLSLMTV